jgi:hypothetical protein
MRLVTDARVSEFDQAKLRFRDVMVTFGVS